MTIEQKQGLIMSWLACGVYRPWFWQNYRSKAKQEEYRMTWARVAACHDWVTIRDGLKRWADERGVAYPPDADSFYKFISPKLTETAQEFFNNRHKILGETV